MRPLRRFPSARGPPRWGQSSLLTAGCAPCEAAQAKQDRCGTGGASRLCCSVGYKHAVAGKRGQADSVFQHSGAEPCAVSETGDAGNGESADSGVELFRTRRLVD